MLLLSPLLARVSPASLQALRKRKPTASIAAPCSSPSVGCSPSRVTVPTQTTSTPLCSASKNPSFIIFSSGNAAGKYQRHPCGLHWLRKEVLALEETPNYLAAVRVKLNNPGMGKAGLRVCVCVCVSVCVCISRRGRKHLPRGGRGKQNPRTKSIARGCPAGRRVLKNEKKPGMSWQTPGQGYGQTSSAHSSGPVRLPEPAVG